MSGLQIWWASRLKLGAKVARIHRFVTIRTFLRLLGAVYLVAFLSFGRQGRGLIGSRGILPAADWLRMARQSMGGAAVWNVPTVLWLNSSDAALDAAWIAGAGCAALAIAGFRQRPALAGCLVLWLSLCAVGQDFLSFQWDVLLVEAGFLALFADRSAVRIWLFRWLIFRLVFSSGAQKLLSGDPTWRSLTALHYHYETQPLPTPLAWYMNQLPMWFHKASTAFVLVSEVAVPFLFFAPRRLRLAGAGITVLVQVLILITGNYTFFNWLTILLTMFLAIEPDTHTGRNACATALATFIGVTSGLLLLEMFRVTLPPGGGEVLHAVAPLRIVNTYGLFASMTTTRPEIIVEGSADGVEWKAYEFKYKPSDLMRAPPVIEPFQPRLDWQMWFAALGSYRDNPWFVNFMVRLLEGEPAVLRLLRYNPFPATRPRSVRARLFLYRFTRDGEPGWWRREELGIYFPASRLR